MKEVEIFNIDVNNQHLIPIYLPTVNAGATGFPSPADDFLEEKLDLNKFLNTKPQATFYVRANGNSMIDAGIDTNDLLVVDRSLTAQNGDIVVCVLDGELLVKKIELINNILFLVSANPLFKPVKIDSGNDLKIWGVVSSIVKQLRKR